MSEDVLKAQLDEIKRQNDELKKQLDQEATSSAKFKADLETREKADADARVASARTAVKDKLETAVKDGRILPAQREALFSLLRVDDDTAVVGIKLSHVDELVAAQDRRDFSGGGANGDADNPKGQEASQELANKAYEYMSKTGEQNFAAALTVVMRANRNLAEEHIFSNGLVQTH